MLKRHEEIHYRPQRREPARRAPDLVRVIRLGAALFAGAVFRQRGLRSMARQREMVRAGSSQQPRSRHLTGHAVDVVAMLAGVVSWEWDYYAQIAVAAARVNAGGQRRMGRRVETLKDGPHFQLAFRDYPA